MCSVVPIEKLTNKKLWQFCLQELCKKHTWKWFNYIRMLCITFNPPITKPFFLTLFTKGVVATPLQTNNLPRKPIEHHGIATGLLFPRIPKSTNIPRMTWAVKSMKTILFRHESSKYRNFIWSLVYKKEMIFLTYRHQIDIVTYQIRKIKADTALCLFATICV